MILLAVTAIAATALLGSCSLKKNTAFTRKYTAFITRYNIHFNGDTHYRRRSTRWRANMPTTTPA